MRRRDPEVQHPAPAPEGGGAPAVPAVKEKNPGTSAVLSLIVPGVGQFYNGAFWRGAFWLVVTPGLWIGSGGLLGWICHLIAAYTAYGYAQKRPR